MPPEAFAATVEGRIYALAKAHSLLAAKLWVSAAVGDMIAGEVAPFEARVRAEGPAVQLVANAVQPFAMVIHELATNAAKHGALSGPEGRVDVMWEVSSDGSLRVSWQESGGPEVQGPPKAPGFGDRLIRQLVATQLGGEICVTWPFSGLQIAITLPSRQVADAADLRARGGEGAEKWVDQVAARATD